jgi:hypothetical protein
MFRAVIFCTALLLTATVAADEAAKGTSQTPAAEPKKEQPAAERSAQQEKVAANAEAKEPGKGDDVEMSGMSILGNDEAPKSLVIVPWKSSQLGDMPGLSKLLDDSTQPVDKDVFLRELAYYQIRSNSK